MWGKKAKKDQAKKKTVIKKYYAIIFFGSEEHIKRKRMIPGNKYKMNVKEENED